MTYQPQPVDTSDVRLSSDISDLTEEIARHAHDVWAQQRIDDGWVWGATRDDNAKQHPCLVPYEELDGSEQQYDRSAALESLKFVVARGYRITMPSGAQHVRTGSEASDTAAAEELLDQLRAAGEQASQAPSEEQVALELPTLLQVWNSRREEDRAWRCLPELYQHLGRRFLKLGEAPLAREVAQAALELAEADESGQSYLLWNEDISLRQIYGLALARSGNTHDAQQVLLKLKEDGHLDEETLGILARTYKDQAFLHPSGETERRDLLRTSAKIYREASAKSDGFWTAINVATLERLLDETAESDSIARHVQTECLADLERIRSLDVSPEETYWHLATLGEVALNLGELDEAGQHYQAAYQAAPRNFGDINTTRRQAGWLLDYWTTQGRLSNTDAGLLDQWLPIPRVVVFAGHMIDRPNRTPARLPAALAGSVRQSIRTWLTDNRALIGYSSAACGADLLFQQAVQELGGESRIVLPYDEDQFKAESVAFAGEEWSTLFDEVLSRATQVVIASPRRTQGDGIGYDYANLILHGLATVRATELGSNAGEPVGLVVWDGSPGDGVGGTASVVQRWRSLGMDVDQVDVSTAESNHTGVLPIVKNPLPPDIVCEGPDCPVTSTRIMAMLFGDAVNFSQLDEEQVGRFLQHFMTPIAEIVRTYGDANVVRNTWGDGLYLVFDHVRAAGLCALDICDFVRRQITNDEWQKQQLPANLNIRLALHAGPVFGCVDPFTNQQNYTGTHVSRAARLEPRTPPGEVYASEAFAALCAEYRVDEFSCDYVKQLAWAKHYGSFPTFVLRRKPT
jgi:class 3 adenylate cyclase/tetratricopeptide (TPR) repeat protein